MLPRSFGRVRHLSTTFAELELSMWQKGAAAYGDSIGTVTSQAADALLDAAGVERTRHAAVQTVYSVAPASFPNFNAAAVPSAKVAPPDDLLAKVPAPAPFSVLDIATGHGFLASCAAERGATSVVGIDTSEGMLEDARRRVGASEVVSFVLGDAAKLPVDDNSFDAVVMGFLLLHLPDPSAALAEAHRVLKPGGRVAFSVWQPPPVNAAFDIILSAIAEHGMPVDLPGAPLPFFHFAGAKNASSALTAAGFASGSFAVTPVPCTAALERADDLYQMFATATARTRATLEAQSDQQRAAIRAAMAERIECGFKGVYLDGRSRSTSYLPAIVGTDAPLYDGTPSGRRPYQIPMPAVVASAAKA